MMDYLWIVIVAFFVLLIGGVVTWQIGKSKENQEESSKYSNETKSNFLRLLIIYGICTIIFVVLLLLFL